ncbi:hypothetical protein SPOG_02966 [Schizosaccharomyces cryophilus OY26]|uniref:Uncharacterized protein n=1 Tax=Schizosaccharomyces cryophilus (strain OY26 / ATCC MYA-4695 / CBS 11777 / NBRC 106824 / NRRL Y48691) TaxID=653667 RepID=S9XJE8_SCHCR|nr:uncharacterized protein SPOG_02966 [Schizosaccharomyces cryophilus OY26]EPY53801.1 hypothetical protein SPOG_02966 [Schizosaccharomyces cryophilus OY26]
MFLGPYRNFLRKNVEKAAKTGKSYELFFPMKPQCFSTAAFLRNNESKNEEVIFGGQSLDDLFSNIKKSMKEKKSKTMASETRKTSGNARKANLEKLDARPIRQRRNSLQGNKEQLPGYQERRSNNRVASSGKSAMQSNEHSKNEGANISEFPPKYEGNKQRLQPLNRENSTSEKKLRPSKPSAEEIANLDMLDSVKPESVRSGSFDRALHKYDTATATNNGTSVKHPRAKSRKRLQKEENIEMSHFSETEETSNYGSKERKNFSRNNVIHLSTVRPQLILPQQLDEFVPPSTSLPKGLELMKKQLQASLSSPSQ